VAVAQTPAERGKHDERHCSRSVPAPNLETMNQPGLAALVAASLVSACSASGTSYRPTTPGLVSLVGEHGELKYLRDGKTYDVSPAGVAEVVAGNHFAEEKAQSFRAHERRGRRMMLGSLICGVAAGSYLLYEVDRPGKPDAPTTGLLLASGALLGCFALELAGMYEQRKGRLDGMDAINIYNDDVAAGGEAIPDPLTQVTLPGASRPALQ